MEKFEIYSKYLNRNVTYNFLKNPDSNIYIYFFDGQNLFDLEECYMDATFEFKEALEKANIKANVIGIYAPYDSNRTNEYTPYSEGDPEADYFDDDFTYKPLGKETGEFIVEELIPHVEKDTSNPIRLIGGASLGGLMSLYMGSKYPHIFSKVLAMSSHFNINLTESGQILNAYKSKFNQKIYMDVGDNEYPEDALLSRSYADLNKMAYGVLKDKLACKFIYVKGGTHHERDWAERMPEALTYLIN